MITFLHCDVQGIRSVLVLTEELNIMFGEQIHHLRISVAKPYFNMPIKSCHPEGINSININLVDVSFGL
jgi:hypothetical protein